MSKRIARYGRLSAVILTAAAAVFTFSTQQALSQTLALGTSAQGTSNNALTTALGKVVNERSGLKVRVVPMGGPEQYAPQINAGRMDMAIASSTDVQFAYDGLVTFKGRPQKNLRYVASLYAFRVAFFVKKDSPIKTISDLKGKRVPIKFSNQKAAHRHYLAAISAAGLTEKDFDGVPVPNVVAAAQDFVQGKLDASWFAVGAGKIKEVAAQVGGIRYLPAETSPQALKRMRKYAPAAFIEIAQPSKKTPGIVGPTPVITETYMLFAGKHVSSAVIAKFLDALYTQKAELAAAFPRWNRYSPKKLWRKVGLPAHPAAIAWFKSKGLKQVK